MGSWPRGIDAITLFVEDLQVATLSGSFRPAGDVRRRQLGRVLVREHPHQPAEDHGGAETHRACAGGQSPRPDPASIHHRGG
jgi:hypothetical protein